MSDSAPTQTANTHDSSGEVSYLAADRGLSSWLFTRDHKRIGLLYLIGILVAFLLGTAFAVLIRLEMWTAGPTLPFIDAESYANLFTSHGVIMVFLVVIPAIPAVLGNFVLPLMLGAKNVAYPRLNLLSFWLWVLGLVCFMAMQATGGLLTGWTLFSASDPSPDMSVLLGGLGVFCLCLSATLVGINFIGTIARMRASGLTWSKMPLFAWGIFTASLIQLAATPVFGFGLLLMALDRFYSFGIFDTSKLVYQQLFWFYAHPAVYIILLPAIAVISDIFSVHSRRPVLGYRSIVWSMVAIALMNFLIWGNHLFTSGQSEMASVVFSFFSFLPAIPVFIIVGNWIGTLHRGAIRLNTVMMYGLGFLFLVVCGVLSGLFSAALSTNVHLHSSAFVVGHLHYIMGGAIVWAFLGGLHHWWPKMTGRLFNEKSGVIGSLLSLVGFNVAFFPMLVMGTRGMPRRHYNYLEEFTGLQQIATVGAFLFCLGILIVVVNLLLSLRSGRTSPANPWGGASLEWQTASPPSVDNFREAPGACDPYEVDRYEIDQGSGGYVKQV